MKISNETKVGALTAIAITAMVLGFNFLRGKSVLKTGNFIHIKCTETKGLVTSNPVFVNGYQVGMVFEVEHTNPNVSELIISVKLKDKFNIPNNSVAYIKENPLGTPSIDIKFGNSTAMLNNGDTLTAEKHEGLMGELSSQIKPLAANANKAIVELDSALQNINSLLSPNAKNNIQTSLANLATITATLTQSAASLNAMLDKQSGSLSASLNNVKSFTDNLNGQNQTINNTLGNVEKLTTNLSKADVAAITANMQQSITELNKVMAKLQSNEGSLGLLINDKTMYNQLTNTVRSANILVDDLRRNPKRYVSFSVFGRKPNNEYLTTPLDTTHYK